MRVRIGVGVALLLVGVTGGAWWLLPSAALPTTPEGLLAVRMAGERWYAVQLRHRPVGHYRTVAERTRDGFRFFSELEFALSAAPATRMEDELVFGAAPPHRLVLARHARFAGGTAKATVYLADGVARIEEDGALRETVADFDFDLAGYLALERWLQAAPRRPGQTHAVQSVDFDRLTLRRTVWRVHETGPAPGGSVVVGRDGRIDETRIHLDADLVPERLALPPLFTIDRVASADAALAWRDAEGVRASPFAAGWWLAPATPGIDRPEELTRLVLAASEALPWPGESEMVGGEMRLIGDSLRTRPATERELEAGTEATLTYPADAAQVHAVALRAIAGLDDARQRANALTLFVHSHLSYREQVSLRTVHDTLRDRVGDCSEFADVLTSLARAAGLPARTVVGIAYSVEQQGFAPHAWNEIAVDGHWHAFDPTWGQTRADATHLSIPDEHFVRTLADWSDVRFRIVEATRDEHMAPAAPAPARGL